MILSINRNSEFRVFLKFIGTVLTFIFFLLLFGKVNAQKPSVLFVQDSLKLVSSQFAFTEGPAVDQNGSIFFTDQPNNKIWKYDNKGRLSLYTDKAGRANGLFFDHNGNLFACADENFEIWKFDKKGKQSLVYKNPVGMELNGPNDLWIDAKGGIYFTDPYYQRDYWIRKSPSLTKEQVFYLAKGKKQAVAVESSLQRPNGIVGTPDGKLLYVGDAKAEKVYRYDIKGEGQLINKQLIINQRSDGMTLDEHGNIYITGKPGVTIFNSKGEQIGQIKIAENHTANVCFGGKNRDVLFITASKSIYTIQMNVRGVE